MNLDDAIEQVEYLMVIVAENGRVSIEVEDADLIVREVRALQAERDRYRDAWDRLDEICLRTCMNGWVHWQGVQAALAAVQTGEAR